MANDQNDQKFDENRPGQERNQGTQNSGMKDQNKDLNRPSDTNRGLNPQGQSSGQSQERSQTGMSDKDNDLNKPADSSRGLNPSGAYTPGRDIDREGDTQKSGEPYERNRGVNVPASGESSPYAQGEPRREEREEENDGDLTELPAREEERKTKTPDIYSGGQEKGSSKPGNETDPGTGKAGSQGSGNWGAE